MLRTLNTKLKNSKCGHGKKICFQPPAFGAKNRRPRPKKLILVMPKILSTKLRNSKCGQGNFFCFQPSTFDAKNKRLKATKLF